MYEVARGISDLHEDEEQGFIATHEERQKAATVAQRRYERARAQLLESA